MSELLEGAIFEALFRHLFTDCYTITGEVYRAGYVWLDERDEVVVRMKNVNDSEDGGRVPIDLPYSAFLELTPDAKEISCA